MFKEFFDKDCSFRSLYLENLINRFSNASLSIEDMNGDYADFLTALNISNQTQALDYALSFSENITLNEIRKIGDLVTGGDSSDFRRTNVDVMGSEVKRTNPNLIYMELYTLLDNYYNIWNDLDSYLREALFHIRFLHIHPFEDGNGRTARVLLIRNLCVNGEVPCIITKSMKKEYCNYIENSDVDSLANLFRTVASKEYNTILNLYSDFDLKGLIRENKMTKEQEKRYKDNVSYKDSHINNSFPLRNICNLISLYKYNLLPKVSLDSLNISNIHNYDYIEDENSSDYAIYSEVNRNMFIGLYNDDRCFKICQRHNKLCFSIDEEEVALDLFEKELNKFSNKVLKKQK